MSRRLHNHERGCGELRLRTRALVNAGARPLVAAITAAGLLLCAADAAALPDMAEIKRSVVRVVNFGSSGTSTGSGFVVAPNLIATNHHVVDGGRTLEVRATGSSSGLPGRVRWVSEELDLAVVEVPGLSLPVIELYRGLPRDGEAIWSIGFPGGADRGRPSTQPTIQQGIVSQTFDGAWRREPLRIIQHSAPTNPGNSGGPLIDDCGRVIGVNTQASLTMVQTPNGPERVPLAAGIYWSSHISALLRNLDALGIPARVATDACVPTTVAPAGDSEAEERAREAGERAAEALERLADQERRVGRIIGQVIMWSLGAILLTAAVVFTIARGPRQRAVEAVRDVSRRIGPSSRASPERAPAGRPPARAHEVPYGAALSGFTGAGQPVRLEATAALLAANRKGLSLGRMAGLCDLPISSTHVSKRHARIRYNGRGLEVEDLNSSNGTRVNGVAVAPFAPRPLAFGDTLTLGDVELMVSRGA